MHCLYRSKEPVAVLPSPSGRRCREVADEGREGEGGDEAPSSGLRPPSPWREKVSGRRPVCNSTVNRSRASVAPESDLRPLPPAPGETPTKTPPPACTMPPPRLFASVTG